MRLNPYFLHGVRRRWIEPRCLVEMRENRAVQREQIVVLIAAIHRHDRSLATVGGVLAGTNGGDTGIGSGQSNNITAVHGQILYPPIVDQIRLRRISTLNHRGETRDYYLFSQTANLEHEIYPHVCTSGDLDIFLNLRFESGAFDLD